MKVAILGPIGKDEIHVNNKIIFNIGSIAYYTSKTLSSLGAKVELFTSFGKEDLSWFKSKIGKIPFTYIPAKGTMLFIHKYKKNNPNVRESRTKNYELNLPFDELLKRIDEFDYVVLAPVFYNDIPVSFIKKISKKTKLVHGNFGMINHVKNGQVIWTDPENLIKILSHLEFLVIDNKELLFATQKKTIDEGVEYMLNNGLKKLIVTAGSEGSTIYFNNKQYKINAFKPKKLVDPTGSGDTYIAGYLKSLELFNNPKEQGDFAAMVATIGLEKAGAFDKNTKTVIQRLKRENK
jgi:sugar/nucleoside kinase (ribokinase family)